MMRMLMILMLALGLLATYGPLHAAVPVGAPLSNLLHNPRPTGSGSLDDQCMISYLDFTYGGYSGAEIWPGGSGTFYLTGYLVQSSCQAWDTLLAYCIDLDHPLQPSLFCATVEPAYVRPSYPEQFPAMAYQLAWHPVTSAPEDLLTQLVLWKLCDDHRTNSPTYGVPWYAIDGGRGYPDPNGIPEYPYVNTVYNTDTSLNVAANQRAHELLGSVDGIPKNVALCDDQFSITVGSRVDFGSDSSRFPLTIQLIRGSSAIAANNMSRGGVKVQFNASAGNLSATEGFTSSGGEIEVLLTQSAHIPQDVQFQICSIAGWPRTIVPCEGFTNQELLTMETCQLCASVTIAADNWLPVELASFDVNAQANGIEANWRTRSEANLARWEIERSAGGADFAAIGTVPAANTVNGYDYRLADVSAQRGVTYRYRLVSVNLNGERTPYDAMIRTAALPAGAVSAWSYELTTNYPNPFNPETTIRFVMAESGIATLEVFDITGHGVATLASGKVEAGEHTVTFRAANLPSGIYFYRLDAGSFSQTRKMVLAK